MAQKRDAPCYQEYAASWMAKIGYRILTMQERGLLWSMRNECWVNLKLPANPETLAKVLGCNTQIITDSLPNVMEFFEVKEGFIHSPDLDDYRQHLADIRTLQKAGGVKGAKIANKNKEKARKQASNGLDDSQVDPLVHHGVSSIVQSSTVKQSQELSIDKDFISGLEKGEVK